MEDGFVITFLPTQDNKGKK